MSAPPDLPAVVARAHALSRQRGFVSSCRNETGRLLASLAALPEDIYEAARLDRANAWQRFRRITLPLLRPAIVMVVIMRTMVALTAFAAIFTGIVVVRDMVAASPSPREQPVRASTLAANDIVIDRIMLRLPPPCRTRSLHRR